jgi:hypothetical protein
MSDEEIKTNKAEYQPPTTRPIDKLPVDVQFVHMCYEGLRVCRDLMMSGELSSGIRSKARDLSESILIRLQDIFAKPES